MTRPIAESLIAEHNARLARDVQSDYEHLGERLARRGVAIDRVADQVARFGVAIPSWGVGTGGTRFARFPGPGEPRHVFDKLQDCAVIQQLGIDYFPRTRGLSTLSSPQTVFTILREMARLAPEIRAERRRRRAS